MVEASPRTNPISTLKLDSNAAFLNVLHSITHYLNQEKDYITKGDLHRSFQDQTIKSSKVLFCALYQKNLSNVDSPSSLSNNAGYESTKQAPRLIQDVQIIESFWEEHKIYDQEERIDILLRSMNETLQVLDSPLIPVELCQKYWSKLYEIRQVTFNHSHAINVFHCIINELSNSRKSCLLTVAQLWNHMSTILGTTGFDEIAQMYHKSIISRKSSANIPQSSSRSDKAAICICIFFLQNVSEIFQIKKGRTNNQADCQKEDLISNSSGVNSEYKFVTNNSEKSITPKILIPRKRTTLEPKLAREQSTQTDVINCKNKHHQRNMSQKVLNQYCTSYQMMAGVACALAVAFSVLKYKKL